MTMFVNKYPNTSRTVSGLTPVYNTDSILEVDTSTVSATINLDAIASGYWNTTWKLYVFDKSNNAATHNITINAGTGQTINGQSSLVINQNGGGVLIRVVSNTKFLGSLTIVNPTGLTLTTTGTSGAATLVGNNLNIPQYSGGGSSLEIKNQGSVLTAAATSIDFVGAGVLSTTIGSAVTVTINGVSVISLTNAALQILITNGTVVAGQSYLVTDAPYDCVGVLLQGVTTKTVTESGNALFYVADYQGAGNYNSLIHAPTGFIGSWTSIVCTVAQYQVIVYDNRNYQNLTGVWGSAPIGDTTNWLALAPSLTTGYFIETDFVLYDVTTNDFTYRQDKRGNKVTQFINSGDGYNAINDFPWGNNKVKLNTIIGNSQLQFRNSNANILANIIDSSTIRDFTPFSSFGTIQNNSFSNSYMYGYEVNSGAEITGNTLISLAGLVYQTFISGAINYNKLSEEGSIVLAITNSLISISYNTISSFGVMQLQTSANAIIITETTASNNGRLILTACSNMTFNYCQASDGNDVAFDTQTGQTYSYQKIYSGFSNWQQTLSALDVIAGGVLTLPNYIKNYVGILTISNATSTNITSIVNLPTNHPVTLKPNATSSIRVVPTGISTATTNQIVETASTNVGGVTTYTGRTNGCDEAILKKYGTLVGLTIKNIFI